MATQAEYDAVMRDIDALRGQIAATENEIAALSAESQAYQRAAGVALRAQQQAQANALRILQSILAAEQNTDAKIAAQKQETNRLADDVLKTADDMLRQTEHNTEVRIAKLRRLLDEVRDPVSGELWPLERVFESLFELHRDDALRADEYGALGYPSAGYDEEEVQAHPYDLYGKLLLGVWSGIIDELTAEEYDALLLSAEAFGDYALSAARYDLSAKSLLV